MKFTQKLCLYYNTIRYLTFGQIAWRLYYLLRRRYRELTKYKYKIISLSSSSSLVLAPSIDSYSSYENGDFIFLNKKKNFDMKIDWSFEEFGKLWAYNINYFEFLGQKNIEIGEARTLIDDFIDNAKIESVSFDPYPTSLRCLNWIKFISRNKIQNEKYDISIFSQLKILSDNVEYHLKGNHLLENAFALLHGAYYFQNEDFYAKAKTILESELEEQILNDGGHFELSPMYHQIMLFRVLDCINLLKHNYWKDDTLPALLIKKAELMLSWLERMTFKNGDIPYVNDSAPDIAPTTLELNLYAARLGLDSNGINLPLSESGYRMVRLGRYELFIDCGKLGPDYLLAHAHSDTFSFILYVDGTPLIVDTGISIYEKNSRRHLERSTVSHNTVAVNGIEQSQIWDGFRVAKRANVIGLREDETFIEAMHDGYKKIGLTHKRKFSYSKEKIIIEDFIESRNGKLQGMLNKSYFHFCPFVEVSLKENKVCVLDVEILFSGCENIVIENYLCSCGYNLLSEAKMIVVTFREALKCEIVV